MFVVENAKELRMTGESDYVGDRTAANGDVEMKKGLIGRRGFDHCIRRTRI